MSHHESLILSGCLSFSKFNKASGTGMITPLKEQDNHVITFAMFFNKYFIVVRWLISSKILNFAASISD